jgi:hypothetical protein
MSLPSAGEEAIRDAYATVASDLEHDLTPFRRRALYNIFAPINRPSGHQIRTLLEITTIRKVLNFWEQIWPEKQLPHKALSTAEDVLQGTVDVQAAELVASEMWRQLDALCVVPDERFRENEGVELAISAACATGYGAVRALYTACGEDPFEDIEINEEDHNSVLDPWCSDAALWASWAYAGVLGVGTNSADKRLEFWKWWLLEAIPAVWEAAQ